MIITLHSAYTRCSEIEWMMWFFFEGFLITPERNFYRLHHQNKPLKSDIICCFPEPQDYRRQYDFAALFFLHVHVKMIILGSRCLTGCKPVCGYSAVGGCVMLLTWVFGWPTGWTAVCQWSCNSGPYLCGSGFSARLSLHHWYCFTQYSSSMTLSSSHVTAECNPVSDVYSSVHNNTF